jgi:hypothetical protein
MRRWFYLVIPVIALTAVLWSCTKDDLCSEETPTTPLLTIEFLDYTDRSTPKPTNDLAVRLRDTDSTFVYSGLSDVTIALPLDTEADQSLFYLINEASSSENLSVVEMDFFYQRQDQYVNRACAFKTIYTNIAFESDQSPLSWIRDIELLTPTVEDASVHMYIYH